MKIMPFTIRWVFAAVCLYFIFSETGWFTAAFLAMFAVLNEYFAFLLRKIHKGIETINSNITFLTGIRLEELENEKLGGFLMRGDVAGELKDAIEDAIVQDRKKKKNHRH